jgi:hypothetical protein
MPVSDKSRPRESGRAQMQNNKINRAIPIDSIGICSRLQAQYQRMPLGPGFNCCKALA